MRFDALTADSGQNRPEFLNWNREKYQEQTAAFWRDKLPKGQNASDLIDGFKFTNWRELNKKYHIEVFDVPVEAFDVAVETAGETTAADRVAQRPQTLLFIYENRVFDRVIEVNIKAPV